MGVANTNYPALALLRNNTGPFIILGWSVDFSSWLFCSLTKGGTPRKRDFVMVSAAVARVFKRDIDSNIFPLTPPCSLAADALDAVYI
jgi:hypothetical protein